VPARREQQNALREGRETDACRRRGVKAAGPGWAGEVPGDGRNRFAALAAARAMVRMSSLTTTGRPPHGPGPGGTKPAEGAVPPREVRARTRKVAAWGVPDRLQPGSGWLALTRAAARARGGQCGSWGTSIWLLRARTRLARGSRSVRQDPAGRRPGVDPAPPRLRPARLAADPDLLHLAHQLSMLDLDARIWNAGLAAGSP